jgi:hypothetical protein
LLKVKKYIVFLLIFSFIFLVFSPLLMIFTSWDLINSILDGSFQDYMTNLKPSDVWSSRHKGMHIITEFEYTDEELAQVVSSEIPDSMKNFYKLSFLFKGHLEELKSFNETSHSFMLGIMSTEASGSFYKNSSTTKDIFLDPSDKFGNLYVGAFGIHKSSQISTQTTYTQSLLQKYPVPFNYSGFVLPPDVNMESLHIPTASYIATSIFLSKSAEFERSTREIVAEVAPQFGVTNVKDLADFAVLYIGQAQYHGASVTERKSYISFLTGVYKLSGEDFKNLKIVTDSMSDYSESTLRKQILGNGTINTLPSDPTLLQYVAGNQKIQLGDFTLNQPLWSYVYSQFPDNQLIKEAWGTAVDMSKSGSSGIRARVLNFHYGLVSYMEGQRILSNLKGFTSNMTGTIVSGGLYDGMTIDSLYEKLSGEGKVTSLTKKYYKSLSKHFGSAKNVGVVKGKDPYGGIQYIRTPSKFNVPFYSQQSKGTGVYETWGSTKYGSIGTFEQNGCHIYSFAYGVSAITGRMVNPPEMAVAMYLVGGLDPSGLLQTGSNGDNIKSLMTMMGVTGYYQKVGPSFNAMFEDINNVLKSGGVVIIRGRNGSNRIAFGDSHFVVLEDIRETASGYEYLMYTSSKLSQNTWHKQSFFGGNNLYNRQYYVLKK